MELTFVGQNAVDVTGLRAGYFGRVVVDEVSFVVRRSSSLAILGLNGSGKTTILRCLLGNLRPRSGTVHVFGSKPGSRAALSKLGYAPDDACPPEFLTAREYLSFSVGVRTKCTDDSVLGLLADFELDSSKLVRDYSKGMRRRLLIAQAVIAKPELLILDEPLNGLDPLFIIKLRERLNLYVAGGGTLLFSSHILTEVEKTCSEVLILHNGRSLFCGAIEDARIEHGSLEALFATKIEQARR